VNTLDGRIYKTGLTTSLADMVNGTLSFNADTMECAGCSSNHAAHIWRNKGESKELTAEAFLLTNQSYPPVMPTNGELSCMKILRREDATIMDLANDFLKLLRGKEINRQGVILIHSLSHMARAGAEGYAEDLLLAASKLKDVLGQQVEVLPLPHLSWQDAPAP
jgi:hypothetical protein